MKRKIPLLQMIAVAVTIALGGYSFYEMRAILLDDYDEIIAKKERAADGYIRLGKTLAEADKLEELRVHLEEARQERNIDFYVLQYKGEPIFWGTADGKPDSVDVKFQILNEPVVTDETSFMAVPLKPDLILAVGINKRVEAYLKNYYDKYWPLIIEQIVVSLMLTIGVLGYYIRDILQFLRVFRERDAKNFKAIKTKSLESEIFAQGLAGYEKTVEDLTLQNQALGRQVLPSLKKEILSGKQPPYDFECTMVRTDINNFSTIYNNHDVTEFMSVINGFFKDVSHVVSRYNGLIHEFVGDEVIFYFKDEDHANSFQIALAAIHDINALALQLHKKTMKNHGYPFTVKSSLAHGTIRFGPLVNGYSIAGAVLIETVRILSQVVEKEGNVVYFDSVHLGRVSELFDIEEAARVQLKGFSGMRTLYACRGCRPVRDVLSGLSERNVQDLAYYRSDADVCEIIDHLRVQSFVLPVEVVSRAIQVLRGFQVTKSDALIRECLLSWMEDLAKPNRAKEAKRVQRILSAASMLGMNLITKDNFDRAFETRLSKFLRDEDKRVVANVLEVLTHFKADSDPSFFQKLLSHDDNRVAANALVREGMRDLSPLVTKRLRKMLASKSEVYRASALYAIGELALYHRTRDVVYYSTNIEFLRLVGGLPGYVVHSDAMIRRQALLAAKKAADENVLSAIFAQAEQPGMESLRAEVEQYIGSFTSSKDLLRKSA